MQIYRVNGCFIDEDKFKTMLIDVLDTYKYASLKQLTFVTKARENDVQEVLENIIIWYIKEHQPISYKKVCLDLYVKSDFIEKLIEEGRLEKTGEDLDDIKKIESDFLQITSKFVNDLKRREAINNLSNSMIQDTRLPNGPQFHTLGRHSRRK